MLPLLTDADVAAYREQLDLGTGPVVAFVGSLDDSKGLPLLFAAASLVHDQLPGFRLIVVGAGPLQQLVDDTAEELSFVRVLPRAELPALAQIGRVAQCLVIPGRIGLVAVDGLALGLPIVTTTYPHHAPEAEYLTGDVMVVADQNAVDLAAKLFSLLVDPGRLADAGAAASVLGQGLSVRDMAGAFSTAVARHLR